VSEAAVATYGRTRIPYRIARGKRRVSVAVVVDPVEGVILRAPVDLERERLDSLVRRKGAWIVQQLRSFEDLLPAPTPREFVTGESFWCLGRQLRLAVEVREGATPAVAMEGRRLMVRVPARGDVRAALRAWYRRRAAVYLPHRVRHWAGRLGIDSPPLLIREPRKRWGSCDSAGRVRINWRVMQVAPRLVDYVVAHELVHLEHPKHDADFWARLGVVMPDAEARRGALRRAGVRVAW